MKSFLYLYKCAFLHFFVAKVCSNSYTSIAIIMVIV